MPSTTPLERRFRSLNVLTSHGPNASWAGRTALALAAPGQDRSMANGDTVRAVDLRKAHYAVSPSGRRGVSLAKETAEVAELEPVVRDMAALEDLARL
jgi:hypothetical protein